MRDLLQVMKIVTLEKKDIFLSILFGFLAGISAVGLFSSSGYLISRAALIPPLYALTVLIAFLKLFGFARAIGRYLERYYSHRATFTMLSNLRLTFYKKLEPYAPRVFQKYRSGDLLARIVGDVESLQNFFLRVYYPPVVMVVIFLATIAFASFFSIYIALTLLIGLILTGFVIPVYFAMKQRKLEYQLREARGKLSVDVTEFLYGFRDLKIYQRLDEKEAELKGSADGYVSEQEREGKQMMANLSVNTFASLVISWVVLGIGVVLVNEGELNGLFLAMLVMASLTVFENATPMAVLPSHFEDSKRASERLFSIVDEVEEDRGDVPLDLDQAPAFSFEDVSYRYPDEERFALNDVTLTLLAGSKTAIVGPSGSGKSTLMQLLLKAAVPSSGRISVGEVDLTTIDQESLWAESHVVLQENHFFYGTIRDNLKLAKPDASDEELLSTLEQVMLDEFDLDAPVFEKGENLSGGEKQRLAIARAMLHGRHVWLLDEPTSSVDAVTERYIYDRLFEQAKDDTLILISHRLTGLEKMDQIIVMEQGTIVESGSYEELMEKQGYFYQMKQIEKNVFGV